MEKKEYNGWYNYQTWLVNLWIKDNQNLTWYFFEKAQNYFNQAKKDMTFQKKENAIYALNSVIKEHIESYNPLLNDVSVYADLLTSALAEVNYYEISAHIMDDMLFARLSNKVAK